MNLRKKKAAAIILLVFGGLICFGQDTVRGTIYYKIKEPFYKDGKGNLYYKYIFHDDDGKSYGRFEERMPLTNWEVYDSLKNIIDVPTYIEMGRYAKDKRHIYYFISNSDGTALRILKGADALTFTQYNKAEGWNFGGDKNFIYHDESLVKGLSPNAKLKIFKSGTCDCYSYFTDGKTVFYNTIPLKGADPKSFKIVNDASYDAEDKNNKYKDGKIVK